MRPLIFAASVLLVAGFLFSCPSGAEDPPPRGAQEFKVYPIGYVKKTGDQTFIVLEEKYQSGVLGVDKLSEIWVLWWFDRNDTAKKRSILQVHPGGNPDNPIRGVFATHSPVRPNLIAMTRCEVVAVKENIIEIKGIDAFSGTPVLDIKS